MTDRDGKGEGGPQAAPDGHAAAIALLDAPLRAALPGWGLAADAPLRLLMVSENATFLAGDGEERIVLRVTRPGYHGEAEVRSEIAWVEALLAARAVETPRPLRRRNGDHLATIRAGGRARRVLAFTFMTGGEPALGADSARWFRRLGETAARLHAQVKGWTPPPDFTRKCWRFDTIAGPAAFWGDWRAAPGLDAGGRALVERCAARLAAECGAYGEAPGRFGLVHGDMRAANLLVDGDRLGLIDFDDCGFSWFGFDFAAAVSFIEHEPAVPALTAAWLEGYRAHAPFGPEDEGMLPAFVMLRRLQLTAWIASHAETATAQALGIPFVEGTVALAERHLARPSGRRAA